MPLGPCVNECLHDDALLAPLNLALPLNVALNLTVTVAVTLSVSLSLPLARSISHARKPTLTVAADGLGRLAEGA